MKRWMAVVGVLFFLMPDAIGQNLLIVSEQPQLEEEGAGNLGDYLRSKGYKVTVDPSQTRGTSEFQGVLTAEDIAFLESFDVVIVHRAVSSGNYYEGNISNQWSELKVPILLGSAYLARNTRWFWVDAAQMRTEDLEYEILVPDHPIVKGLTGEVFDTPLGIDHVGAGDVGEGTVVARIFGTENPAIIAWGPNDAFCAAGGRQHTYPRVFIPIYRYHETTENAGGSYATDPADGDFINYTENGLSMYHQAIQWLLSFSTDVSDWSCY
ncbi:MAG TPA: hypothetical protein PK878_13285 [bacterium]|nr:hypothetical protein [bacterium]HPP00517.1 hypothetical protein [bacterium]